MVICCAGFQSSEDDIIIISLPKAKPEAKLCRPSHAKSKLTPSFTFTPFLTTLKDGKEEEGCLEKQEIKDLNAP